MRERFQGVANDMSELIQFMNGSDRKYLVKLVSFFSSDSRYLHPRELKKFWESLTETEKNYYRGCVALRLI